MLDPHRAPLNRYEQVLTLELEKSIVVLTELVGGGSAAPAQKEKQQTDCDCQSFHDTHGDYHGPR